MGTEWVVICLSTWAVFTSSTTAPVGSKPICDKKEHYESVMYKKDQPKIKYDGKTGNIISIVNPE